MDLGIFAAFVASNLALLFVGVSGIFFIPVSGVVIYLRDFFHLSGDGVDGGLFF